MVLVLHPRQILKQDEIDFLTYVLEITLSDKLNSGSELWSNSSPARSPPIDDDKPDFQAQRKNLSLVAKIATRALIDPCLEKSILIEEFYPPLVQFLYVLECVLLHGWKQKTSMFNRYFLEFALRNFLSLKIFYI